jgi:hypothetical protein
LTKKTKPATPVSHVPASEPRSTDGIEGRLVAYAEQLGWVVGTVQAKAEGWLDRAALAESLTRIRDGAADLLAHLAAAAPTPPASAEPDGVQQTPSNDRPQKARAKGRSGGIVDAPRKRHRTPPPSRSGVKHSDQRIAKTKAASTNRQRGGNR